MATANMPAPPSATGTSGYEDWLATVDTTTLRTTPRTRLTLQQLQKKLVAKRAEDVKVAARDALVMPPVSAAEVAGRYTAAARAQTRARAGVPPTIGRPGRGPATAGGSAY